MKEVLEKIKGICVLQNKVNIKNVFRIRARISLSIGYYQSVFI